MLVIETVYIAADHDSKETFDYGRLTATSSIIILTALCVRYGAILSDNDLEVHSVFVALDAVQILAVLICSLASLSLPRRPSVFDRAHAVEGQYTVSAVSRYTFGWAGKMLALARNQKTLDLSDLPKLHLKARSAYLQGDFESRKKRDSLWKGLVIAHYAEIIFQTIYAVAQSAAQFAPQLAMYWLLKTIEKRSNGAETAKVAWAFVLALGLSIVFASWGQAWAHFIAYARLAQPVRSELSAMIFSKATRRKDVKGVQKAKTSADMETIPRTVPFETNGSSPQKAVDPYPVAAVDAAGVVSGKAEDDNDEDILKTRQSTINLVVSLSF